MHVFHPNRPFRFHALRNILYTERVNTNKDATFLSILFILLSKRFRKRPPWGLHAHTPVFLEIDSGSLLECFAGMRASENLGRIRENDMKSIDVDRCSSGTLHAQKSKKCGMRV